MAERSRRELHASDLGLDILTGDDDLFRWFLLCFLFGKPIQSDVVLQTWRVLLAHGLDTPWAILEMTHRQLVRLLDAGKYKRYDESTARGLHACMEQLVREYEGSLVLMVEYSADEEELSKRLQKLFGVGPKVAEIFLRETDEFFARRLE